RLLRTSLTRRRWSVDRRDDDVRRRRLAARAVDDRVADRDVAAEEAVLADHVPVLRHGPVDGDVEAALTRAGLRDDLAWACDRAGRVVRVGRPRIGPVRLRARLRLDLAALRRPVEGERQR